MGAELARKRRGEGTQTGMSEKQLEDFARKGGNRRRRRKHQVPQPDSRGYY